VSGNPGGRKPISADVKLAFAEISPKAIQTLFDLLDCKTPAVALGAAREILDRHLGLTPSTASYWVAFRKRLRELGYREGENRLVEAFDGREEVDILVENLKGRIGKGVMLWSRWVLR
jgi:hypothetical protein